MDQSKGSNVKEWPIPYIMKQLQRFLGLTNFYRWFIRGFIAIAAHLTSLLKNSPLKLRLNKTAT